MCVMIVASGWHIVYAYFEEKRASIVCTLERPVTQHRMHSGYAENTFYIIRFMFYAIINVYYLINVWICVDFIVYILKNNDRKKYYFILYPKIWFSIISWSGLIFIVVGHLLLPPYMFGFYPFRYLWQNLDNGLTLVTFFRLS